MGEGKTGLFLVGAVVAAALLAIVGIVYVRTRPAAAPAAEFYRGETATESSVATSSERDEVAGVLNADDYLDEAVNDLDAVNF